MKHYLVFGPEYGTWPDQRYRPPVREGMVDLKIVGQVRAMDLSHAIRAAKTRGFRNPIVKEKVENNEVVYGKEEVNPTRR